MRSTIDIDVLTGAEEMARRENSTAGRLISRLPRERLTGTGYESVAPTRVAAPVTAAWFRTAPPSVATITNDVIYRLRYEKSGT